MQLFQGQSLRVTALEQKGVFELCFDRVGDAINKFDDRTVAELREAVQVLQRQSPLRGLLVTSAKDVFIVGADVTEFGRKFSQPPDAIAADVARSNQAFVAFEDLPIPTVVAVNGFALGGGLEFVLACSLRVMSDAAQVGVPEVKLGLFPGFGGTVRLSRVAGPEVACEWVATGRPGTASTALRAGVVDAVCEPRALRQTALDWLDGAMDGEIDWAARQERKRQPLRMAGTDVDAVFRLARERAVHANSSHQPAAVMAVSMMRTAASLDRTAALALEAKTFGEVARTQAAASLVQAFLNEQAVKKRIKGLANGAPRVRTAAVLGAGIMGGGIAVTSALKGIPVRMKDVRPEGLEQGMSEARKQVARQVKAGRLTQERGAETLVMIRPQLDDEGFADVDLVIEAIVEDLGVKQRVLAALENVLTPGTVIASNTSSLRIDDIARPLARPEDVVGMHFFNPVPMMSLVEIVRGPRTRETAVAAAVGHVVALGKTPIVVKDCPGFLVNRLLTAYIRGFLQLLADGADFVEVDQAMEAFGWPMGPAYLEDVVGMDTGSHVNEVISAGYPERMPPMAADALKLMAGLGRLGQKSGLGFYRYRPDPQGKPVRSAAEDSHELLAAVQLHGKREFSSAEIVDRMMLPMIVEAAHALDENVVATPAELDMALRLGLGFPAHAGGPLQYADWLGLDEVVARCERLRHLGPACEPTPRMRELAARGGRFHDR
jgi:3-hydroxyacyl-CoA dehydrogenase / enoyl-CoA hydratase / 3-hydroxybutyryl-CoA epimerase / enoyl-CoA isomerase